MLAPKVPPCGNLFIGKPYCDNNGAEGFVGKAYLPEPPINTPAPIAGDKAEDRPVLRQRDRRAAG